jgi:flagellar biosynthesis/type III secretory pathway M-ring protein FliF/YscJ
MARGDQLIVESLPFESTLNSDPPALPETTTAKKLTPMERLKSDPKILLGIAAAVVVLFCAAFAFFYTRKTAPTVHATATQALPQGAEEANPARLPRPAETDAWTPSASASPKVPALAPGRMETLTNQVRTTAQSDAEVSAGVLRGWLKEERA